MAGPTLDLRIDCLKSPTHHDVAIVSMTMLWPGDNPKQGKIAQREQLLDDIESALMLKDGIYPIPLSEMTREQQQFFLSSTYRCTKTLDELKTKLNDEMIDHGDRGFIAGKILLEVAANWAIKKRISLDSVKDSIADWYSKRPKRFSKDNIHKIWSEWRLVAPLWAAYASLGEKDAGTFPFPITPERLGNFLATMRYFRGFGVEHVQKYAKAPMLNDEETFDIDPRIVLPLSPLRFKRVTE
jgi:hypothetical protein